MAGRFGVVVAMASEARALAGRTVAPLSFFPVGEFGLGYLAGIGPERAKHGANALVAQGVGALMSWGIAGGLHASVPAGHVLLPQAVLGADRQSFASNAHWRRALVVEFEGICDFADGLLIQSDVLVAAPAAKHALHRRSGALAVDMESCAIAHAAFAAELPFLAVRVVADECDDEVPGIVVGLNDPWGRVRPLRLLRRLLAGPQRLGDLLTLRRSFDQGCKRLTAIAPGLGSAWERYLQQTSQNRGGG